MTNFERLQNYALHGAMANHKQVNADWTKMDERERRANWDNIVASAKNKN